MRSMDILSALERKLDALPPSAESARKSPGPQATEIVQKFAKYLLANCRGPENAKPNAVIAKAFKFRDVGTSGREGQAGSGTIAQLVLDARKAGHPICADRHGLYYATELDDTVESKRQDTMKAIKAVARLHAMETASNRRW